jgi:hypothetical protein
MRWDILPRKFHYQDLERWYGSHRHQFTSAEIHALIAVGAVAAVAGILAFVVWGFS